MLPLLKLDLALQAQRGHLLPWVPVCFAFGISVYFWLPREPGIVTILFILMAAILAATQIRRHDARALLAWAVLMVAIGIGIAALRANRLEAPVLSYRYYGPVEGRLIAIDRSSTGSLRLTLDQVRLAAVSRSRTPEKIRISVSLDHGLPTIGARIATTAHLLPPQGPSEPGGFDYRRYAWFLQLGANGYSRTPIVLLQPPGAELAWQQNRQRLTQAIQRRLPGEVGALAAAIITGDRSGVKPEVLHALRGSNLAHLLAISGLHMGMLAGFVFAALRFGLCLCPPLALRWDVKKIAACGALIVAAAYLGLSGGNVATERAFIMVSVALCAVLLNRRALSLRAVAVAAGLVLLRRPETLLSPGFQMSFAATTALIAVFGWFRERKVLLGPNWLRPIGAVLISSGVAGLATAPFAAAHFNFLSHYGLLANVLAVPIMGILVMPAAALSLCLMPIGLENGPLWLLDLGLQWILLVAREVSSLHSAFRAIPAPGDWPIPLLVIGGLFVVIWQGRLRWVGFAPVGLALLLWSAAQRPAVLVSANGGLVGVNLPEGRALSRERGQAYVARSWLQADGEMVDQKTAAARWPVSNATPHIRQIPVGSQLITHVIGKRGAQQKIECQTGEIVVSDNPVTTLSGDCLIIQPDLLKHTGSLRINPDGSFVTAAQLAGDRLWSSSAPAYPIRPPRPRKDALTEFQVIGE